MQSNQNLKLYFLLISFNIFFSIHAHAGNYTWIGSDDPTWYRSTNWSPGGIPGASDTVTISSTAAYNLTLDSSKTVYRFIISGDTVDFGGKILTVSGSSSLSGGYLTNGTIEARGGSVTFSGTIFNVTVSAICTSVLFNGSTFNQPVSGEITGSSAYTSSGGNTFNSTFTVINGTSNGTVNLANTSGDYFNGKVTVVNTGRNSINFALNDTTFFNDSIVVNSTSGGVAFGSANGIAVLASGKQLVVGNTGFSKGALLLNRFIQSGSTAQSLSLTGSAIISLISSTFNGTVTYSAPGILVKKSTFNSAVYFTKTDSVSNVWYGENTYNGVFRFTNNGSGSVQMQTTARDIFADSVTINAGSASFSGAVKNGPETGDVTVFYGSLYTTGSTLTFGSGDGTLKFTGTAGQVIKGSVTLPVINMIVDKSSGTLTLQAPVTISNNLDLTNGILLTDTTNMITLLHGATCSNASASSYVSGPMKKTGDAAFTFPVGKGGDYHPVGISAPSNTTDAFVAEYINTGQTAGDSLSDSVKYIYDCFYWKLKQTTGTSNVYVTLGWDNSFCVVYDTGLLRVSKWDGAVWADLGRGTFTGITKGTLTSSTAGEQTYYLALAHPILVAKVALSGLPVKAVDHFYGLNGKNIFRNAEHDWRFLLNGSPNDNLIKKLQNLYPEILRFNAGTPGNYFDWRKGCFFDDSHLYKYNQFLRDDFYVYNKLYDPNYQTYDARLFQFKQALDFTGALALFEFNISSSDIDYQLALLLEARRLNIPIKYVELGNELYLPFTGNNNVRAFPSGKEYADSAYRWTRRIKELLGEDVKVGVCGGRFDNGNKRKDRWTEKLMNELIALENANTSSNKAGPDAIILHHYISGGLSVAPNDCEPLSGLNNLNTFFRQPYKQVSTSTCNITSLMDAEIAEINTLAGTFKNYEIWITEYGLDEKHISQSGSPKGWLVHGSWAHGLFNALQTLLYADIPEITMVVNFTLWSNCVFGNIFVDEQSFYNNNDDQDETARCYVDNATSTSHTTAVDELTAMGHAMKHIGKAFKNTKSIDNLNFSSAVNNIPIIGSQNAVGCTTSVNFPGLYGFYFSDGTTATTGKQLVILNVSNADVTLDLNQLPGSLTNYDITTGEPGNFVLGYDQTDIKCMDGTGSTTGVDPLTDQIAQLVAASHIILLPPYSIIRVYNCTMPGLTITASANPVCSGEPVTLNLVTPLENDWTVDYWSVDGSPMANSNKKYFFDTPVNVGSSCDPETTIYTVSVTNTCGTTETKTASVSIDVYHAVNVSITTNDNLPSCPGAEITLSAASSMINCGEVPFYEWITADGDGVGNDDHITVSPEDTITYILYANWVYTNPDFQCAAVASLKIMTDPPPLNLPADTIVCQGDLIDITLSQYDDAGNGITLSDFDFIWSDENGIVYSGNGANHFAQTTALAYGQHTITVEVYNAKTGSCTLAQTMTVYVSECCDNNIAINAGYNYDGDGLAAMLTNNYNGNYSYDAGKKVLTIGLTAYQNLEIPLNGKFAPDYSIEIYRGQLMMGEGAEVVIRPHQKLLTRGCRIHACTGKLWRGIKLQPAGFINTNIGGANNAAISDAEYSITASHLSTVNIVRTDFDKNYVSLYVPAAVKFPYNEIYGSNNRNNFTCNPLAGTGTLLSPYTGQTIATGDHPFAGMELHDVSLNVDDAKENEDPTAFSDLNNGIIAINSSLLVNNATFTTMKAFDAYSLPLNGVTGTGIFAGADAGKHGFLYQRGLGISTISATPPLTFNDCVRGIHTNNTSADISLNQMDEISNVGIYCENGRYADINVSTNQIKSYFIGMHFSNNRASASFNVKQNEVGIGTLYKSSTVGQIGILVDEIPSHLLFKSKGYKILCNQIFDNFFCGTQMTGLHPLALVKNNTVNMSEFTMPNSIGMEFSAVDAMTINSNKVYGDDITIGSAYHFSLSNNPLISDNISNGSRYGFDFQGGNTNTRFITNFIGFLDLGSPYHDIGLHLDPAAVIGQQFKTVGAITTVNNNRWLQDPNNGSIYGTILGGARNDNSSPNSAQLSQFKVPNSSFPGDIDYPYNYCAGGGIWFFPETLTVAISPGYADDCTVVQRPDNNEITVLDSLIAMDSVSTEIFEPETKFILASDLFDKLDQNPGLMEGNSLFAAFYDSVENTIVGKLSKVRAGIQFIFEEDTNVINEIYLNDSLIKSLHVQKSVIDSLLESGTTADDSLAFIDTANEILGQIGNFIQKQNDLIAQLDDERQAKIDSADSHNNTIGAAADIEVNEKTINGIYLDKIVYNHYNLDSTQLANLDFIAPQCPFSGGRAVYTARVIKRMLGDTTVYNDSLTCAGLEYRIAQKPKKQNNFFISVSPNPLNESCVFNYLLPKDTHGKIEIFDIVGNKIDVIYLNANSANIEYNASSLISGLYQFRLIADKTLVGWGKMAIVK